MIAVIFEVDVTPENKDRYLSIAGDIRPLLDDIDGFISVERFQSLTDPDKILSLSLFEDEAAIARWRNLHEHREAQKAGRNGVFKGYRLRIADIVRDYGMFDRDQVPSDTPHPVLD